MKLILTLLQLVCVMTSIIACNLFTSSNQINNSDTINFNSIFGLITHKKESPEKFHHFDFSKRFTQKEISELNLDTTKIKSNEFYFLTAQRFLRKDINGYKFTIFFKHQYGDQLEKILRIQHGNSVKDITLAMKGGDSDFYEHSTEFLNDSLFKETSIHRETVKDDQTGMGYQYDSIIKTFKYDINFGLTVIKKDSFICYKEDTYIIIANQYSDVTIGKIKNQELFYDCIGCSSTSADKIIVFTKNGIKKDILFNLETLGSYVDEISVVKIKNDYFIYINTNTGGSGNSNGYLYSVDLHNMKTYEVKIKKSNYRLPENLSILKSFELSKDKNDNFSFGGLIRDEKTMKTGSYLGKYELVKIRNNHFILKEKNEKLELDED